MPGVEFAHGAHLQGLLHPFLVGAQWKDEAASNSIAEDLAGHLLRDDRLDGHEFRHEWKPEFVELLASTRNELASACSVTLHSFEDAPALDGGHDAHLCVAPSRLAIESQRSSAPRPAPVRRSRDQPVDERLCLLAQITGPLGLLSRPLPELVRRRGGWSSANHNFARNPRAVA